PLLHQPPRLPVQLRRPPQRVSRRAGAGRDPPADQYQHLGDRPRDLRFHPGDGLGPGPPALVKILAAPDSFKGSLKSPAAARAMAAGARAAAPEAEVVELPVGDGGEGTLEALVAATGGEYRGVSVTGPLGERAAARLGLLGDGDTVFVEMAEASGLS